MGHLELDPMVATQLGHRNRGAFHRVPFLVVGTPGLSTWAWAKQMRGRHSQGVFGKKTSNPPNGQALP